MKIFKFVVGREKKGQAVFSTACSFARLRGGMAKLERKDGRADKRSVSARKDWRGRVARLPQGL